jgi:hypothetical protein
MRPSRPALETLRTAVVSPVRALAFWAAIALPLLSVPMLTTGVVWEHPLALLSLFLLNGVALLVGHGHKQPDDGDQYD